MLEQLHVHIIEELKTNTRTDTIFVLTAILLNLVILGINSAIAENTLSTMVVMFIFVILIIVVNFVAEIGLIKGKQTRTKLISGLIRMYKDSGVDSYYDSSLLEAYKTRYNLFMLAVLVTGIVAIVVPFITL
jgi:hypothetical protein